jgi:hypothetical protein
MAQEFSVSRILHTSIRILINGIFAAASNGPLYVWWSDGGRGKTRKGFLMMSFDVFVRPFLASGTKTKVARSEERTLTHSTGNFATSPRVEQKPSLSKY